MTAPRTYATGATAYVTVHDDGTVTYDFDISEAANAPLEHDPEYATMYDEVGQPIDVTDDVITADVQRIKDAADRPWVRSPLNAVIVLTVPKDATTDQIANRASLAFRDYPNANPVIYASPAAFVNGDRRPFVTTTATQVVITVQVPATVGLDTVATLAQSYFLADANPTVYPSGAAMVRDFSNQESS